MKKVLFVLLIFSSLTSFSQVESFIRTYGTDGFNYGQRMAVLQDTTYMLLGNKSGFNGANNIYLIHTDENGQILKDAVFGGQDLYYATDMAVSGDTLFIITGHTMNSSSQEYDVFVLWIDKNLNLIREVQYSAPGWDLGKAVSVDDMGNVYVVCETYSFSLKAGIILLRYTPGGMLSGEYHHNNPLSESIPQSMVLIEDSLYVCGSEQAENEPEKGMILKTDTAFFNTHFYNYYEINRNYRFNDITMTGTNTFAVTGYYIEDGETDKKMVYMIFHSNLTVLEKVLDIIPDFFCNCIAHSDFGLTALGCHTTHAGAGNVDFMHIVYQNNNFQTATTIGGLMYDEPFGIAFAHDSSLVMIGTTQSYGTPITSIMFAKTCKDFYYCVDDNSHQTNVSEDGTIPKINIFPNPADDVVYALLPHETDLSGLTLYMLNINGSKFNPEFSTTGLNHLMINVSQLKKGMYFLIIETTDVVLTAKVVKI
jgi:hypothetical protein